MRVERETASAMLMGDETEVADENREPLSSWRCTASLIFDVHGMIERVWLLSRGNVQGTKGW